MTPNQQVLSDEQLCEALTTAYGSPEWTMDDVRAARAIESATLAALAQHPQEPVSPDMHGWCAYVGGMVAHWVMSEPNAHVRLGDDQFEAAIAGIIERRLWAMPKRDTTPQPQPAPPVPEKCLTCNGHALIGGHLPDGSSHGEPCPDCNAPPVPAPVDEREALKKLESVAYAAFSHIASANYPNRVKEASSWLRDGFDEARAALQSPAPQEAMKGGEA